MRLRRCGCGSRFRSIHLGRGSVRKGIDLVPDLQSGMFRSTFRISFPDFCCYLSLSTQFFGMGNAAAPVWLWIPVPEYSPGSWFSPERYRPCSGPAVRNVPEYVPDFLSGFLLFSLSLYSIVWNGECGCAGVAVDPGSGVFTWAVVQSGKVSTWFRTCSPERSGVLSGFPFRISVVVSLSLLNFLEWGMRLRRCVRGIYDRWKGVWEPKVHGDPESCRDVVPWGVAWACTVSCRSIYLGRGSVRKGIDVVPDLQSGLSFRTVALVPDWVPDCRSGPSPWFRTGFRTAVPDLWPGSGLGSGLPFRTAGLVPDWVPDWRSGLLPWFRTVVPEYLPGPWIPVPEYLAGTIVGGRVVSCRRCRLAGRVWLMWTCSVGVPAWDRTTERPT